MALARISSSTVSRCSTARGLIFVVAITDQVQSLGSRERRMQLFVALAVGVSHLEHGVLHHIERALSIAIELF